MDNLKIIFFGSSSYVIPVLETVRHGYEVVLVVTTEDHAGQRFYDHLVKEHITFISVVTLKDDTIFEKLQSFKADVGVAASFRLIIGRRYRELFPHGIINIHPSLLPEYRGTTPVQTALLDGKTQTGVSVIQLDAEMDHGPVIAQEYMKVFDHDTSNTVYTRLFELGSHLVLKVLRSIYLKVPLKEQTQDEEMATFTIALTRDSGYLDMKNLPKDLNSEKLRNMIRAFFPWPGVWTTYSLQGNETRIKLLPNELIQAEGKKAVSYKDFVNGYPEGKELLEKLGLS